MRMVLTDIDTLLTKFLDNLETNRRENLLRLSLKGYVSTCMIFDFKGRGKYILRNL